MIEIDRWDPATVRERSHRLLGGLDQEIDRGRAELAAARERGDQAEIERLQVWLRRMEINRERLAERLRARDRAERSR